MTPKDIFLDVVNRLYGIMYRWGGDDPETGFDCSGLVVEGLQSAGAIPHGSDETADSLWRKYRTKEVSLGIARETSGALFFYLNTAGKATHVEVSLGNGYVIGAIGGGPGTVTPGDAAASNAFVKIRPVNYRGGPTKAVNPWR